jgi:DNA repair photolyase
MSEQFSLSQVEYASHQLSLYYGPCPHDCIYCYLKFTAQKRKWKWSIGDHRRNPKAFNLAKRANPSNVRTLVVSFTSDPLPIPSNKLDEKVRTKVFYDRLDYLSKILDILERRVIKTKVLTKNANILEISYFRAPYKHISFGLSITTNENNEKIRKHFEPNSSSIKRRLFALDELQKNGFKTWCSIEPILPKTKVFPLLTKLSAMNIPEIWIGKGNYHPEVINAFHWEHLAQSLFKAQEIFPNLNIKWELRKYCRYFSMKPLGVKEQCGKL